MPQQDESTIVDGRTRELVEQLEAGLHELGDHVKRQVLERIIAWAQERLAQPDQELPPT